MTSSEKEQRLQIIRAKIQEACDPGRITDEEMLLHFERRTAEVEKSRKP